MLDEQGRLFIAAHDTESEALNATAISSLFIREEMDRSNSRSQVLILDCCHGAAFGRGAKGASTRVGTAIAFEPQGHGRVVLTASDATQFAWEEDNLTDNATSIFTRFLVQGLQNGDADCDGDGQITVDEWYAYAYEGVVETTSKQHPQKIVDRQQGALVLARSVAPPAPKPVEAALIKAPAPVPPASAAIASETGQEPESFSFRLGRLSNALARMFRPRIVFPLGWGVGWALQTHLLTRPNIDPYLNGVYGGLLAGAPLGLATRWSAQEKHDSFSRDYPRPPYLSSSLRSWMRSMAFVAGSVGYFCSWIAARKADNTFRSCVWVLAGTVALIAGSTLARDESFFRDDLTKSFWLVLFWHFCFLAGGTVASLLVWGFDFSPGSWLVLLLWGVGGTVSGAMAGWAWELHER